MENPDSVAPAVPPVHPYTAGHGPYGRPPGPPSKSPLLAAFWSALIPGLGHVYVGIYQRAMIIFVVWVGIFSSTVGAEGGELGVLVPMTVFTWLFNIFDAYRQATLAMWGEPEEIPNLRERGKSGLTFGIALFVIGLYGLLRKYFEIDLSILLDHWYLVVMAAGGWLIWQAWSASSGSAAGRSADGG